MGCSWDDKDRTRRRFAVVNWHQATATNLVRVRSLWSNRNAVQNRLVTVRVLTITTTIKKLAAQQTSNSRTANAWGARGTTKIERNRDNVVVT